MSLPGVTGSQRKKRANSCYYLNHVCVQPTQDVCPAALLEILKVRYAVNMCTVNESIPEKCSMNTVRKNRRIYEKYVEYCTLLKRVEDPVGESRSWIV